MRGSGKVLEGHWPKREDPDAGGGHPIVVFMVATSGTSRRW
jgi:hypothetical protein